jgi:hypothetical protein
MLQELSKVHAFEDQFAAASQAQATKFGLPAIAIDELPDKLAPLSEEHTISAEEVKWLIQKAKQSAEHILKTEPRFADPYSSEEFRARQAKETAQSGMTPDAWKKYAVSQGLAA